jgi:hypothetical protein
VSERTYELVLSGLPEERMKDAMDAFASNRPVDARVLGFYGTWIVTGITMEGDSATFRLKPAGYSIGTAKRCGRIGHVATIDETLQHAIGRACTWGIAPRSQLCATGPQSPV